MLKKKSKKEILYPLISIAVLLGFFAVYAIDRQTYFVRNIFSSNKYLGSLPEVNSRTRSQSLDNVTIAKNGKSIVYTISDMDKKALIVYFNGNRQHVFSSDLELPTIMYTHEPLVSSMQVSSGGTKFAYTVDQTFTDIDGTVKREGASYVGNTKVDAAPGSLIFSPVGNAFAYIKINPDNDEQSIVLNGVAGKAYKHIWQIQYSDDGQHYYYIARNKYEPKEGVEEHDVVVRDGEELANPCWLNCNLVTSPNKNHYAFYGSKDPKIIFSDYILTVDDKTIELPRNNGRNSIFNLTVSNAGDYEYALFQNLDNNQDLQKIDIVFNGKNL